MKSKSKEYLEQERLLENYDCKGIGFSNSETKPFREFILFLVLAILSAITPAFFFISSAYYFFLEDYFSAITLFILSVVTFKGVRFIASYIAENQK